MRVREGGGIGRKASRCRDSSSPPSPSSKSSEACCVERRDGRQGAVLRRWMDDHVLRNFGDRIIAIDTAVAVRCARLHGPDPKSERDAMIAATALVHGLVLVTRNVADFKQTGVEIVDPWANGRSPSDGFV